MDKYKGKGLTGLANMGNTCFMNSTMQCLSHTYEFNDFLDKEEYKKNLNKNVAGAELLKQWDDLRKFMWSENCTIRPGLFIRHVQQTSLQKRNELFTGFNQNDLPEFLGFVIECFHDGISRKVKMEIKGVSENNTDNLAIQCYKMIADMYSKEYSEIIDYFYGIHVSTLYKKGTKIVLQRNPEPFFTVSVPIPQDKKNPSLQDCMDLYSTREYLEGYSWTEPDKEVDISSNKVSDSSDTTDISFNDIVNIKDEVKKAISMAKKTVKNVEKQIQFWSLPKILVIDIKRFNMNLRKNHVLIDIPIKDFDLSKYVIGYNKEEYKYDLYGVCNHFGNVGGGHYTAYVKNANGKWFNFNDTRVSEIDENNIITNKAYCLFYRKQ